MNWMLLLSDLSARLLGLLGAIITASFAYLALTGYETGVSYWYMNAACALWSLVKTLQFLWPPTHDRTIRRTHRLWPRLLFIAVTGLWLVLGGAAITGATGALGVPDSLRGAIAFTSLLPAFLFVIFFVLGLGYRAARAQMDDAEMTAVLTSPRAKRKAAETHLQRQGLIRKHDIWDALLGVPLAIPILLGFLSLRSSTTIPTAEHAAWVEENMIPIILGIAFVIAAVQLVGAKRAPTTELHARWSPGFRLLVMLGFGVPLFTLLTWYFGPTRGLPYGWHMVTDQPVATHLYQVTDIRDGRRSSVCVTLQPVDAPEHEVQTCGFTDRSAAGLWVGAGLEATGELSRFGHTLQEIRVVGMTDTAHSAP